MEMFRKPITHLCLIALFGILAYSNTFHAPFQFDDMGNIVDNPVIKDFGYYLDPSEAAEIWPDNYTQFRSRIFGYFTFALNYSINGFNVTGYHIVNFFIHVMNAALVYVLVLETFRTPFYEDYAHKNRIGQIAFFSGLLFISHPLQTQAVTYIVQRFASLATLFYLAGILTYIRSRLAKTSAYRLIFYILALISALLSLKTKEIAVTLPLTIAVYELCFFRGTFKKRTLYLIPFLLILIVVPLSFMGPNRSLLEASKVQTTISRFDYMLTQFTVIATYLRLLIFPANQNLDYDYPLHHSFFDPNVFASFTLIFSVFALGLLALSRSRHNAKELRLIGFGILWFFITLLPESSLIPIVDLIFEHRLYLPSVGAFIAIVTLAYAIVSAYSKRMPVLLSVVPSLLLSIAILLCIATYERNIVWTDEAKLWQDVITKSPNKSRGYSNLGEALYKRARYKQAIELFSKSIILDPTALDINKTYANRGMAYYQMGQLDNAMKDFNKAIFLNPFVKEAYYYKGEIYLQKKMGRQALLNFRKACEMGDQNGCRKAGLLQKKQS